MIKSNKNEIGVYKIEINGQCYIGSTAKSFKERWYNHLNQLRRGKHRSSELQEAYDKFGESALSFSVLERVANPDKLIFVEQKYIDELKPYYNKWQVARYGKGLMVYRNGKWTHIKHPPNKITIVLRPELGAKLWAKAEKEKTSALVLVEEAIKKLVESE